MAVAVIVAMTVVMVMAERKHTHEIYKQSQCADDKELPQPLRFPASHETLNGFNHNLDADQTRRTGTSV